MKSLDFNREFEAYAPRARHWLPSRPDTIIFCSCRVERCAVSSEDTRQPEISVENEIGAVYGAAVQAGSISIGSFHYHAGGLEKRVPTPMQVPSLEGPFVNRENEVGALDRLIERPEVGLTPVAVITGARGIGKTSIGRYWAHLNGEHFEGGQLHADFNELRRDGGVDISALLGSFLRALGFEEEVIPEALADRSALFISKAAEKKILLLLDNVDFAAQVKPLLPGPTGSVVLVTSRSPLEELIRDGAAPLELEPLQEEDGVTVLRRAAGDPSRLQAETEPLKALVTVCAGLPIALKVCGALLAREAHRPVSWLAGYLADESERLRRLGLSSEASIAVVFDESCKALAEPTRRLYRRLGLLPGRSFNAEVAMALAETSLEEAQRLLVELRQANLIEGKAGRFRFHDLLRIHARQAAEVESPELREAALRRVVDYYVSATQRMDYAIIPVRLRLSGPAPGHPREGQPSFKTTAEAMYWFDQERANILAVLRAATAREWDTAAWRIGEALWLAYHNRKAYGEAIEIYTLGAEAAARLGDDAAEARLRSQLARAYIDLDDCAGAERELKVALQLADAGGNRELWASVVEFTGVLAAARKSYREAIEAFERARSVCEERGSTRGIAIQEYHLGRVLSLDGQSRRAVLSLKRAASLIDPESDGLTLGRVRLHLGEAQRALGERKQAAESLSSAIEIMRTEAAPFYEALARERLARVKREQGETEEARGHLEWALDVYTTLSSSRADQVRLALAGDSGERA